MDLLKLLMIGIVIGGGMILPGVSGGVLAVVFGVYEAMIDTLASFFKNIKKSVFFLAPLLIGVILGVFLFGKVLFFVFEKYPMESKYTFIGLILGGIPVLFREIKIKGEKKVNVSILLLSFFVAISLFVLGKDVININFSTSIDGGVLSTVLLFLTGLIFIAGKIIPGISSSFLLILIGMYQFLLNILNNPTGLSTKEYLQLIPFSLGIIIGGIALIKIMRSLMHKHFTTTYSAIIGFVIGSIAAIYPGFSFDDKGIISIALLILSFFVSYKFTLTGQKDTKEH